MDRAGISEADYLPTLFRMLRVLEDGHESDADWALGPTSIICEPLSALRAFPIAIHCCFWPWLVSLPSASTLTRLFALSRMRACLPTRLAVQCPLRRHNGDPRHDGVDRSARSSRVRNTPLLHFLTHPPSLPYRPTNRNYSGRLAVG